MKSAKSHYTWLVGAILLGAMLVGLAWSAAPNALAQEGDAGVAAINVPSNSSPIAFGGGVVWVVNPDDDSVSLIDATSDTLVNKIFVGDEPRGIALDNSFNAYVTNAADNTVTFIQFNGSANLAAVVGNPILTGGEPWDIVTRPNGDFVYVANSAQNTISVISTATRQIVSIFNLGNSACNSDPNRHFQPRGLAITGNGGFLFVARFLSFTTNGGKQAVDTGKEGLVCRLTITPATGALSAPTSITLPAQDTGFNVTIGGAATPTSAYPNQLQSIVICGNGIANERAYLPNIAASPTGPLRFNVDTQAFVNTVSNLGGAPPTSLGALNLHLGARDPEAGKEKLFFANPWAMACNNPVNPTTAYVVSAGSDLLVKLNVSTGNLGFTVDSDTTRYINLNDLNNATTSGVNAGKNPLGIVVNNIGSKAYVMNYISRNVSVVDLATDSVIKVIKTTDLPPAGSQGEQLQVGAEMFFSSRGIFDGGKVNRLSSEGWQNCASCHPGGLTDSVVWRFGAGPRKSVPLNSTWSPFNPDDQRVLNYSAIFDELEDFELNVRGVSGPGNLADGSLDPAHGLLIGDNGDINAAPGVVNAFALPNAGRPQLTVTLPGGTPQPALTALKEWVRFAIRTPKGAATDADGLSAANGGLNATTVAQGRRLFFQTGCQKCHGGTKWTISNKDFTSPPAASEIFTEAGAANAIGTQFLNRFLSDIGSFNLNVDGSNQIPGQPQIGATEKANAAGLADTDPAAKDALGIDHNGDGAGKGFNIPSLLGIWALQPYYHNGACETLACVMNNVTHRTAGLRSGQADLFTDPTNRTRVIEFLKTIDSETDVPTNLYIEAHDIFIDPPTVIKGTTVQVGANISLFGTTADLANLAADSGVSSITVRFTFAPANAGTPETVDVALPLTDFTQDFGQATVTTNWTASTTAPNLAQVTVTVDPANQVVESNETDNTANRRIRILNPPPDTTPPQITKVIISPNTTFDPEPQITQSRDVKVQIIATDDKELKSFCIVRYSYDVPRRRWVEESCFFQDLPAPTAANTFVVDTRLRPSEGVGYVFVWVKDAAGNISRRSGPNDPSFDFINFIPAANIRLNRNDSRLFRLTLNTGTTTFTFKPQFGDIDVSVFQGFGANAPRCALSANNGPVNEIVSVPGGACTGTQFQIEVFAIANSRFTIETAQSIINASQSSNAVVEQAAAFGDKPLVGGPPAIQTAIGDEGDDLFLPIILK